MDAGNNETEYVLTESYELSDWDSDSVSFSIGYSTEFNFLGGKASIETGYALDWTKSFERSLHEEWSQSFSAQAYNSVVVSRTPVFVYEYDIQKADGTWNDKTVMQTAIPQGPVYEQLSVDAYNKFATEYNKWIGTTDTGVKAAGTDGTNGTNGADGLTPSIGENGNWWIGETDTGVKAAGTDGTNGTNGADGLTPSIGENGNWWIGATDTGVKAAATDGADGKDGADGTNGVDGRTPQLKIGDDNLWYVSYDNGQNWESLNVKATGEMGATGAQGEKGDKGDQGEQGIQGVQGEKGDKGDQGEQGIQGVQGEKGDAGADGASGQNGTNGINGKNGVNGQDGQNGQDGKDGQDGTAGRGIDNAMIDNDGYLILTMTDGTTINAGLVRDTSAVANKEANDSATAKSLATAAVGLSGASLLWNIAMLALSITMKRKYTTFHR